MFLNLSCDTAGELLELVEELLFEEDEELLFEEDEELLFEEDEELLFEEDEELVVLVLELVEEFLSSLDELVSELSARLLS